jgi:hypothetical protein
MCPGCDVLATTVVAGMEAAAPNWQEYEIPVKMGVAYRVILLPPPILAALGSTLLREGHTVPLIDAHCDNCLQVESP